MQQMEPRFEHANKIILHELDEITEVILFVDGQFDVGFDVNSKYYFQIRYQNSSKWNEKSYGAAIGDYGCSMNKNSRFIYRTATKC